MDDNLNKIYIEVVGPKLTQLLDINKDDFILDTTCGNGNYSAF